jgi:hypothetical protein
MCRRDAGTPFYVGEANDRARVAAAWPLG